MVSALDFRCSAALNRERCQLLMGHDGPHALMFSQDDRRVARTWGGRDRQPVSDRCAGFEQLPWLRGFPVPAWAEMSRRYASTHG